DRLPLQRAFAFDWKGLWNNVISPGKSDGLDQAISEKARSSAPLVWMLGKVQSGKSSIIQALTGSTAAEIGDGFRACTRTSQVFDFPSDVPIIRFLDTRGLGEIQYE